MGNFKDQLDMKEKSYLTKRQNLIIIKIKNVQPWFEAPEVWSVSGNDVELVRLKILQCIADDEEVWNWQASVSNVQICPESTEWE